MLINRKMAETGGGSVFVVYLSFVAFFGRIQVEGLACSSYDSSQVLRMCQSGEIKGQSVYLDTSSYNGLPSSCTCRMETTDVGSRVVFDPVVVDSTNCGTAVLLYDYAFVTNCSSTGKPSTFLSVGVSVDVIVRGRDTVNTCVNLRAENPATNLTVTCYEPVRVTSSTSSTSTTTRLPPTTITTLSSISTETPVIRACQATGVPVLDMCKSNTATGGRLYMDSSFFTDQYLSCTCSVQAVSQFGGTVEVYPQHVDNSNCNTNIYIDDLSFYIGCRSNSFVEKYLGPLSSLDLVIRGEGRAGHCLILKSPDSLIQVTCSEGRTNTTSTTTSPTSTTTSTATTSITTTVALSTTESTSAATTTATKIETTSATDSTQSSSSSTSIPSSTSTSSTSSTSSIESVSTTESASTTHYVLTSGSESTKESVSTTKASSGPSTESSTSSSTSTYEETPTSSPPSTAPAPSTTSSTTKKPNPEEQLGFSVTGLIIGLVVLLVVILVVIGCCLCHRRKHMEEPADDQKFTLFQTPEAIPAEMLEVGSRSVDNPLYYEGDTYSSFPKHQRQEISQSKVISPFDIEGLYTIIAQKEFVHHTDIM